MSKKTLSRREFLHGSLAGLAGAAAAGFLGGCSSPAGAGTSLAKDTRERSTSE